MAEGIVFKGTSRVGLQIRVRPVPSIQELDILCFFSVKEQNEDAVRRKREKI